MDMKGQGLSMSILVVAAIAVMVLLILGVFFTGGFRKVGGSMMEFVEGSSGDQSQKTLKCSSWCTKNLTYPGEYPGYDPSCPDC